MSWLKNLRKKLTGKKCSRRASARPGLEELENRWAPAVFTVTSLGDNVDAADGVLTLREALEAANANGNGADTVNFAITGTIDIGSVLPALNNVTLDGPGAKLLTIRRGSTDSLDGYRLLTAGGTSEISGVTLANGRMLGSGGAAAGGALTSNGNVTLRGVHVTGNSSPSEGGGVAVLNGNLTVIDSTFSDNSAANGGAIWIGQGTSTLTVTNSTFSGNTASSNGGAIRLTGDESVSLLNVTITDNTAGTGGGIAIASTGQLTTGNSIFAGNHSANGPDIRRTGTAPITSLGGNLVGNNTGAQFSFVSTDQFGTGASPLAARLGPLADNGGPTPTHALLLDSPALNAGVDAIAAATDQRGVPRPMDGQSDIGAFEVPLFVVTSLGDTVDGTDGVLTLREALQAAAGTSVTDIITFAVTGTIGIGSTLPALNNVILAGPGASLLTIRRGSTDPANAYRLLTVVGADNEISGVTLTNGVGPGTGGAAAGGALTSNGNLILRGVHVTGNLSNSEGGGVAVLNGNLTVLDSTFSANTANNGGGIWIGQGTSTLTVINSTFSGNIAAANGGAIRLTGDEEVLLLNVTITRNSAATGGGIAIASTGHLTTGNTIFAGNFSSNGPDIRRTGSAPITSLGGNLVGNNTGASFSFVSSDQFGTGASPLDARLGPLAYHGGPTPTHALLAGSPASDRGDNAALPADTFDADGDGDTSEPLPFDQRGFLRSADSADGDAVATVDIGAVEMHPLIEDIGNQATPEDTPLAITFNVGDGNNLAAVVATSNDTTLVPNASLQISGSGSTRTLTITPAADGNGSATITVTLTATSGQTVQDTFTLDVTAVNDPPTFSLLLGDPPAIDEGSGPQIVNGFAGNFQPGPATADDESSQTLVEYLVALVSSTGSLSFGVPPALSNAGVLNYTIDPASFGTATFAVTARDSGTGANLSAPQTFTIRVNNVAPTAPVDADGSANSVDEGAAAGTLVGITVQSSDASGVSYALTLDGGGRFQIGATDGVMRVAAGAVIDFDTATFYDLRVRATDPSGLFREADFTVFVNNRPPAAPVDDDSAGDIVAEGAAGGTTVGLTAFATDPAGGIVTYALSDDAGGRFQIDSVTGVVFVANGGLLNFESASSHSITVQASDAGGLNRQSSFLIAVTNQPPAAPTDADAAADSVAENAATGTAIGITALAADPAGGAVAYTLTDNAGGRFQIDGLTGIVTVAPGSLLDFESATNHSLTVRASDPSGAFRETTFSIAVTNEAPATPLDVDAAPNTVAENAANGTTVGIVAFAADPAGGAVSYALSADAGGRFQIDSTTGVVTVANGSLLDFESAASHPITARASDASGAFRAASFTIAVGNQPPSAPVDTDVAADRVAENATTGTTVGITAFASDPAGGVVAYTLTDDAGGRFQIDGVTGVVRVADGSLLDFESATSHDITVRASDPAGLFREATFTIAVTNLPPSAPLDSAGSLDSVAEGAAVGAAVGITALAAEPAGGPVAYTLSDDAGGRFQIDSTTGVVSVANGSLLNFETATSHSITVRASDPSGAFRDTTFSIAVLNEAPATPLDADAAPNTVAENAAHGTTVGIVALAADPAGGAVTYTLSDDANGRFRIDSLTGVVSVANGSLLDFESATRHDITVRASDASGAFREADFSIAVALLPADHFSTALWADYSTNSGWTSQLVGDFNADGFDDIVNFHPSNGTWWVSLSDADNGNLTFLPPQLWADYATNSGWTTQVVGDFNGDGRDDIANFHPSNGTWWVSLAQVGGGFVTALWADYATNSGWTTQVVGDFNGDGRDDIANFHPTNGTWWVSLAQVGGGFVTILWADYATNSGWTAQLVGDFNGDGRDDIANFHPSNGTWCVSLAQVGGGFVTTLWADYATNSGWTAQRVGDFNGDGYDDLANFHPGNGTWWVSLSDVANGNLTFLPAQLWADYGTNSGWTTQVVGDFTGDGLDDLANFHPSNGTWWVSAANGTQFTTTLWADYGTNSGWTSQVVGNFNGDAFDDLANFHPSNGTWWVSLAAAPNALSLNVAAVARPDDVLALAPAQLDAAVAQAFSIFANLGVKVEAFSQIHFAIANLAGRTLAQAGGNTVILDVDAGGHGWSLEDVGDADDVDLLSVVLHELGHELGLAHGDAGFMAELIGLGERRLPTAAELDRLLARC